MHSFSVLKEKTLFVAMPEGTHPSELIGATKGSDQTIIYSALTATKEEIEKLNQYAKRYDLLKKVKDREQGTAKVITNLKIWSLPETTNKAIQIKDPTKHESIQLIDSLTMTIQEGEDVAIEGYLACHRADGTLTIKTNFGNHNITFKQNFTGGNNRKDYQHISISLKAKPGPFIISVSVNHNKPSKEDDKDCFYFLSDLHLTQTSSTDQPITPRINGTIRNHTSESICKIYFSDFVFKDDAPLYLEWSNGQREEIFSPINQSASFAENHQHTFKIKSKERGTTICLYINDKHAKNIYCEDEYFFTTLPTAFLNGEPAIATLTDPSGSQILDQIVIQPPRSLAKEDTAIEEGKKIFPMDFSLRNSHRLESIKQNLINPSNKDPISIKNAIKNLELNYKTLKLEPIAFPKITGDIKASIIIPAHNKVEATYYCLCSLLLSQNKNNFEIVVVDDGSTDKTQVLEDIVKGITVIHIKEPLRFIDACNKGASVAKGEFIVLLNNDTEVTSGWLDALIDGFERFDQVGLVGSRLLYPDGRLQDAGGIIWKSGDPWNYGNGQNPWDPRFSYARQVDYLSGAALMTTKKIWDEVGGLSNYLKPMYFEDTDLSFKIRDAGYKTYFIPHSTIYHFEGITSGTDTSKGFKKYQEINRPKFKKRWSHAFSSHSPVGTKPDLEKDRNIVGRILFIDYQLPREDRDAGSYAALKEVNLLQSLGFKATFLPVNLGHLGEYTTKLQNNGVEVIISPFYLSPDKFLEDRGSEFDVIYVTRYNVLQACFNSIIRNCGQAKIILCNADLHFLRELRAAARTQNPELLAKVKKTQEEEFAMMDKADVVISYNEIEHSVIFSHSEGKVQPLKCPWVAEIPQRVIDSSIKRQGLSFLGSFKHPPNKEGIQWFIQSIFPYFDKDIDLNVYGSGMTEEDIEDLSADKVNLHGFVEHVHDAFDQHKIFIAPLLSGAGIKGKVLSAAAHGIPTILSPVAAEGTGLRHGQECLVAETTDEWKEAIHRLLDDESLWLKISSGALAYIEENFSFESGRKDMRKILESIDIYSSLP